MSISVKQEYLYGCNIVSTHVSTSQNERQGLDMLHDFSYSDSQSLGSK